MAIDTVGVIIIAGISCALSFFTQIINKLLINEKKADLLTKEINNIQNELKNMDPKSKEFNDKQERMIDINLERMKMQFKPMLYTFIPYIIIFYFITSNLAYSPFAVGEVSKMSISGKGYVYSECLGINQSISKNLNKDVVIGIENCTVLLDNIEKKIEIGSNKPVLYNINSLRFQLNPPERKYIDLPFSLPLIGNSMEWLSIFIISSLFSSMIWSKTLKGKYLRKQD